MTSDEFRKLCESGLVFLDGATGTNLQKMGMPIGVCPESWIIENPDTIKKLQSDFVDAGTNIVYAPTFTGNRLKLSEYGLEDRLDEINSSLVALSKEAVNGRAYVAGDMTMTGHQIAPMGDLQFEELVDIYKEQAISLYNAGVDLFVVETMMSIQETRAAVIAIREVCDLPIMATLTFEADGRTLFGTPARNVPVILQGLGVDAIGLNCSTGPDTMTDIVKELYSYSNIPVIAKPNAGLPEIENDETVYKMTPDDFAISCKNLVNEGVRIIGGCCGTTPAHIEALINVLKDVTPKPVLKEKRRIICSERDSAEISVGNDFFVIGERINPTGKKKLQAQLIDGDFELVREMARDQEALGARVLDVNVGMGGIDEKETMLKVIDEVTQVTNLPLCIDSSFPEVIEAALRIYLGRALINSISYESAKFERLLEVAKKYGAMFIFLPVSDSGIPASNEEKHGIVKEAIKTAKEFGFSKEDIVVDALVATVGADKASALSCMDTFKFCVSNDLASVCGLSNISFGLPERSFINSTFLTMGIASGLTMAIANPSQDLLMNTAFAANLLLNRHESDIAYIKRMQFYSKRKETIASTAPKKASTAGTDTNKNTGNDSHDKETNSSAVFNAVLNGDKNQIVNLVKEEMSSGLSAKEILDNNLIGAINEVGDLFDKKKYFLPQLIASAGAMETAIAYLEPFLGCASENEDAPVIVIATVEGDVHDIGKNLVALMLRNYGYKVIDLGKNVDSEDIIDCAMKENAKVIALSALMTTTMMNMKKVIALAKDKNCTSKIIVGGAAVTEGFANEIGAAGYSTDAADCVNLVKKLLAE